MKKILHYIWVLLLFVSCNSNDKIKERLVNAYNDMSNEDYTNEINLLFKENPKNFYVNTDIGYLYLLNNDLEKAENHFIIAEKNRIKKDKEWNYKLFCGLADLKFVQGDWQKSLGYSEQAMDSGSDDQSAIRLTAAKSALKLKKFEESLNFYKYSYENYPEFFVSQDWNDMSELSILYEDYEFTYDIWMQYWKMYGYEPGLGLRISVLAGKLSRKAESFLASFIDLDYQRSMGLIGEKEQSEYLEKVKDLNVESKLVEIISAYISSDWNNVSEIRDTSVIASFLYLSARIESKSITQGEFESYIELLPYFHNHPQYFDRAIKSGLSHPDLTKQFFIEKAIIYSSPGVSRQYRDQLGLFIGLNEEQLPYFLIPQEIRNIEKDYIDDRDLEGLRPLIHFLNLPQVYATKDAIAVLTNLKRDPVVEQYIKLIEESATGVLKLRLRAILEA